MDYRIEIGIGLAGPVEQIIAESVADARALFPNQAYAVQSLAQQAHRRWLEYASGKRALPNGKLVHSVSGSYLSSIKIEEDGEMRYVIYSDDPKAQWIEEGFSSWDMKKMLQTSPRAKRGEDGSRYMSIPFRHKTQDAGLAVVMPREAQTWWLKPHRRRSAVSGHYLEEAVNGGGQVTRNTYIWGDRLTREEVEGLGLDPDSKAGSRLVGMVKFQHNEDDTGEHVTFRTMSEKSSAWLMPARAGYYPAKAAYDWVIQNYEHVLQVALEADMRALGAQRKS